VLNKLYDFDPDGFTNSLSTEKYTSIAQVSRATTYRELTDLVAQGVLVKSEVGRGTRYGLAGDGALWLGVEGAPFELQKQ
jgi:Fic family protein